MAGWNLTGNAVSAEFDGSDEQERKELSVSQAVEIAAGALIIGRLRSFPAAAHTFTDPRKNQVALQCVPKAAAPMAGFMPSTGRIHNH